MGRPLGPWDILSSSRAKFLPIFLMVGILNGEPRVYGSVWAAAARASAAWTAAEAV